MTTTQTPAQLADYMADTALDNMNRAPGPAHPKAIAAVNRSVRLVEELGHRARPVLQALRDTYYTALREDHDNGHADAAVSASAYEACLILLDQAVKHHA